MWKRTISREKCEKLNNKKNGNNKLTTIDKIRNFKVKCTSIECPLRTPNVKQSDFAYKLSTVGFTSKSLSIIQILFPGLNIQNGEIILITKEKYKKYLKNLRMSKIED